MSNPFKKLTNNAKETKKKWLVKKDASIETKGCPQCGAPRPQGTNLVICNYCRYQFMDINIEIKDDKF